MAHGLRALAKVDSEFAAKSARILANGSRYMHPMGGAALAAQRCKRKIVIGNCLDKLDFTRRSWRGAVRQRNLVETERPEIASRSGAAKAPSLAMTNVTLSSCSARTPCKSKPSSYCPRKRNRNGNAIPARRRPVLAAGIAFGCPSRWTAAHTAPASRLDLPGWSTRRGVGGARGPFLLAPCYS